MSGCEAPARVAVLARHRRGTAVLRLQRQPIEPLDGGSVVDGGDRECTRVGRLPEPRFRGEQRACGGHGIRPRGAVRVLHPARRRRHGYRGLAACHVGRAAQLRVLDGGRFCSERRRHHRRCRPGCCSFRAGIPPGSAPRMESTGSAVGGHGNRTERCNSPHRRLGLGVGARQQYRRQLDR